LHNNNNNNNLLAEVMRKAQELLTSSLWSLAVISNKGMAARNDLRISLCFAMSVASMHLETVTQSSLSLELHQLDQIHQLMRI